MRGLKHGLSLVLAMSLAAAAAPAFAQKTPEEACASMRGGLRTICIDAKRKELAAQTPQGPVQLNVNNLQRINADNTPYEQDVEIRGAGLHQLTEINWSWTGPRNGQSTWRAGDEAWKRVSVAKDGKSARIRLQVLGNGDKPGLYKWTAVFFAGGQQVTRTFDVNLEPTPPLSINGIGQRIETRGSPYEHEFQLNGASLNRVTEIRWTWRGPRSGQTTWKPNDNNWKRFTPAKDGKSARVRQTLIGDNDPSGLYGWTVTFVSPVGEISRSFDVEVPRNNGGGNGYNGNNGNGNGSNYNNGGNGNNGNGGSYDLEAPRSVFPGATSNPGPIVQNARVKLEWEAVRGADYYELSLRDVTSNKTVVDQEVRGTTFNATLDSYRSYRWTVSACNRNGCSGTTRPAYFRTP